MNEKNSICPMSGRGCPLDQGRFEKMAEQIGQIYTVLFGVEGQGGINNRVETLEKSESARAKVTGWAAGAAMLIGFVISEAWEWIKK